jgi:glycosyltransferase involved in cell wall biosynthesis
MDTVMRQARVLIVRNAYQQDTGGAEQYAFNFALALKRAGHVPFVVTKHRAIHEKCAAENIESIQGVWHESQEWGKHYYLRYVLMPLWYCWLILRHRITVVHPQSRDDFVFATNAGFLLRRKVLWTDHADLKYVMDRVNHRHPRMQRWVLKAARHAKKIICVSNSEQRSIAAVAPELEQKLTVVHNGVFLPEAVKPVAKTGKLVVGTNARLVPAKGISELMAAFSRCLQKRPDMELWLLGGFSHNKERYESEAEQLRIFDSVRFIGYVNNPNDYVASMDVFVHASYHEAFSLAIIEAAMLGRPIIATAVGGTPEIIDRACGVLVPPKDIDALYAALEGLIADPKKRQKLADNAQKKAVEQFNFQTLVESKVVPLYFTQEDAA